ncbi:transposase, partial [Streptococcus pseudopneumoniae]|nr:transposase [Streptococcus pseudopneumoniae]
MENPLRKVFVHLDKSAFLRRKFHLMKMEMFPVETEEITYKRKKAKGKRQALLAQFDSEEVHHRLEDCICPDCQGDLKEIGATLQGQELVFIPA